MKILKYIPLLFILTLFNTSSYAENCDDIKMDSSVNILKKLKCKAGIVGTKKKESTNIESSATNIESSESEPEKKKSILGKIFQKPKWMK